MRTANIRHGVSVQRLSHHYQVHCNCDHLLREAECLVVSDGDPCLKKGMPSGYCSYVDLIARKELQRLLQ